ncbi:hypothetical protein BCR39DRAFT_534729 [Naematelia encephala]|uniref:Uncharacterized protein n=1 Tax=Naematelia encephala TaxID=71784 RepID=A0A1Y2B0W4_9TREE|nr:hypothetical protein BCR39DRAFT_534729 [Naematelia encephala]
MPDSNNNSYVVISGGTGANSFVSAFGSSPAFVLPVSDDGGSSAEILRCFGGPSIGDIRSRLIRLIPVVQDADSIEDKEIEAIYNLMAFRFPADVPDKLSKDIWEEIVEGRGSLWQDIGEDKRECIRAFLVHFQTLCLRRAHKRFSFRNFSLGNGFLTGARELFGSLPSAIFLFKSIAGLNAGVQVIPVINTNHTITIAAKLANDHTLVGQCNISHPIPAAETLNGTSDTLLRQPHPVSQAALLLHSRRRDSRTFDTTSFLSSVDTSSFDEIRGSLDTPVETASDGNLGYRKGEHEEPLEAPIERIFYINPYGQEIFPDPNPSFLAALSSRSTLVYSCGSLYTSIVPTLALRGVATAIATSSTLRAKVLFLNVVNDRETPGYTAIEYVDAVVSTLRRSDRPHKHGTSRGNGSAWPDSKLVSHLVYLEEGAVEVDPAAIEALGVKIVMVPKNIYGDTTLFSQQAVQWAMAQILPT